MNKNQAPLIFDGHNDVLLKLLRKNDPSAHQLFMNGDRGHLDLPRMNAAGFGGGMFAIFVPSEMDKEFRYEQMQESSYDLPLPGEISFDQALPSVIAMVAILCRIQQSSNGQAVICKSARQIRRCFENDQLAMVMHMEGAEAIDRDFNTLQVLHRAGLRSLGPVWSRPTQFGHGVPFRYPASPDTGPGLTDLGKALVKACNELNMVIDLSHMNEKGFWDVASLSGAPLIATHSNVHAISAHARNLNDNQLAAIKESNGMVGFNFATAFIRPDGRMRADTSIDLILRHLDYLIEKLGVDRVGFGSDFDGAMIPQAISDVTGLCRLRQTMREHGYDDLTMAKLCHENWINVLERTFGE